MVICWHIMQLVVMQLAMQLIQLINVPTIYVCMYVNIHALLGRSVASCVD